MCMKGNCQLTGDVWLGNVLDVQFEVVYSS